VQVSVVLATGTLVVRTAARVWALGVWQRLAVVVDAPVSGSVGAASVHVYVDGVAQTLETVADYSGAPVATASAWSLGGDNSGANLMTGRVAQWGVLNYALTPAQVADHLATARLPQEGAGAMQLLANGSFETFTGTADDSAADTFAGWTLGTLGDGVVQAVSGGADGGYCMQISTGADLYKWATQNLPPLPSAGTVTISAAISGDGTSSGSWGIYNTATSAFVLDSAGVGNATALATSGWTTLTRTWNLPANGSHRLHLYGTQTAGGIVRWDAVQARLVGTTLASGSVETSGLPVALTLASGSPVLFTTGGKIHVAGGTASSPLAVTVILQRA